MTARLKAKRKKLGLDGIMVGEFVVVRVRGGYALVNGIGEGMVCKERALEAALRKFFNQEF